MPRPKLEPCERRVPFPFRIKKRLVDKARFIGRDETEKAIEKWRSSKWLEKARDAEDNCRVAPKPEKP